jgi:hypothetical protein
MPTRILFLGTCGLVVTSTILTILTLILENGALLDIYVDYMDVAIMLGTAPHFLFFCRYDHSGLIRKQKVQKSTIFPKGFQKFPKVAKCFKKFQKLSKGSKMFQKFQKVSKDSKRYL